MNALLQFDPITHQLTGPAGSLMVPATDEQAHRFLMLAEGQCVHTTITDTAKKYGVCRQRYYQTLTAYLQGGMPALLPKKTGPKSNYRRTDQLVRQVLRYRFLDPDVSPAVIVQKLRQTGLALSLRSVERVIAEYGLQKKTLRAQPQKSAAAAARAARRPSPTPGQDRSGQSRRPGAPGPGRQGFR